MTLLPFIAAVFVSFCIGPCASNLETISTCVARFPNGTVVDLAKLKREDGRAKFRAIEGSDGSVYYYDPCGSARADVTVVGSPCCKESACVCWRKDNIFTNIGDIESAKFGVDRNAGIPFVDYQHKGDRGKLFHSRVFLICQETPEERLEIGLANETIFIFKLFTASACQPTAADRFWDVLDDTVLIRFNVAATIMAVCSLVGVLYILFGVVFINFREGTTGKEIIARSRFWRNASRQMMNNTSGKNGDASQPDVSDRAQLIA